MSTLFLRPGSGARIIFRIGVHAFDSSKIRARSKFSCPGATFFQYHFIKAVRDFQFTGWTVCLPRHPAPKIARVVLILFVTTSQVRSQTADKDRFQVFAPNTYELARYGDLPVDLSAGIPQINLPLLTFSDKDINLDISLSYHASGIKVDQEATWVGLGWALNAGGVITREIRGIPDAYSEFNNNFIPRTSIPEDPTLASSRPFYDQLRYTLTVATEGGTDNGADIFYYNFNGRAGKFFLDDNAKAVFTNYEDLIVEFVKPGSYGSNAGNYFIITDEKGVKYEFKESELTMQVGSGGKTYDSTWYLSKITSPSGGEITIEYIVGGLASKDYQQRCYNQIYFPLHGTAHSIPEEYKTPCINFSATIQSKIPWKITDSSGDYIEFVASGDSANNKRKDSEIRTLNRLDYIALYNYQHEQVRKFRFNYSYFEANNSHKFPVYGTADPRSFLNYRLRLDSFQEVSTDGQLNSPYRFEYYGDDDPQTDDPYTLPYRLSPCQDHFGYYNNTLNRTIFPNNPADRQFHKDEWNLAYTPGGNFGSHPSFTFVVTNGGNRNTDPEGVKAGMLNKIVYPSGGYTRFEFEQHEMNGNTFQPLSGGVRVKQIETQAGSGPPVIRNFEYLAFNGITGTCIGTENPYFTWYWQNYNSDHSIPGWPRILIGLGVPPALTVDNDHILRVDGTPQLLLGSGANAFYAFVQETSPGNGWTTYEYSSDDDVLEVGYSDIDGLPTPGHFYGSFVDTYGAGRGDPSFYSMPTSACMFPFPNFLNNDWRRGHLLTKKTYSEQNVLLTADSIFYDVRALKAIPGYKTASIGDGEFFYSRYYQAGGIAKPVKQINEMYNDDGTVTRAVKELSYSATAHKQLTDSWEYSSKKDAVKTNYYYPTEYGNTLSSLKDQHILAPVDVRSYRNGKLISGKQMRYNEKGLPVLTYKSETKAGDVPFNAQSPFTFSPKVSNTYNTDNTLRSQALTDGTPTVFLWSYKGMYPVAQIQNVTYEEIKTALNDVPETFISSLRGKSEPSAEDMARLNGLRDHPLMKDALVTTYTHKPLIGMTSQRDPRGKLTTYEYDVFQRLKTKRNDNEDILESYQYHFKP